MNEIETTQLSSNFLNALVRGDANGASEAVSTALSQGLSPTKVYLRALMPALSEIESLWAAGKISVAEEHLATQITLHEMARLRQIIKPKAPLSTKAVIASVDGDAHFTGARVLADFLFMDGWEVDFLGTCTATADLIKFVSERKVDLVGLTATTDSGVRELTNLVQEIKKAPAPVRVIVGGPAVNKLNEAQIVAIGADGVAVDPAQATQVARKICGLAEAQATLNQYLKGLGQRILEKRKQRQYTQQELAGLANLDRAYISSVEHGKQNMTIGAIYKLAEALEIPLEDLLVGLEN